MTERIITGSMETRLLSPSKAVTFSAGNVTMTEPKVLRVQWVDAHCQESMTEEELKAAIKSGESLLVPYYAYGCLVAETERVIVIAQGVMPKQDRFDFDETIYRRLLFIPKDKIREIWEAGTWKKFEPSS